jgi:ABC-type Mn2+/Zn2+ transport system permease subunit
MACTTAGLVIAYFLDWPAGASIAVVSIALYLNGMGTQQAILRLKKA